MATEHDQFMREVGARLAEVRRARRLTQEGLAELVGVDPQTVQRAETGRQAMSLARLRDIAEVLDLPLAELFRSVQTPVPEARLDPQAVEALAAWRAVPPDRRDVALRVLRELAR